MRASESEIRQLVREELVREDIGWDSLPDGWDEDSLDSFARSLTGKTKDDPEGFFTKCVERLKDEDGIDDPEAMCASLKDSYLGTTGWRGEDDE